MTWQPLTPALAAELPAEVRHWADMRNSVSAEIERVMQAPMTVAVIRHEDAPLLPDETGQIDPAQGPATIREVVLWAAGEACLVARTAYAAPELRRDAALATLGARPLGALLFAGAMASPFTQRDLARVDAAMPELHALIVGNQTAVRTFYWARRTLFLLSGAPILCTEVFLPGLLARTLAALPQGQADFTRL